MEMERRYFLDMRSYLKETLKVKAPLVGTADHSHSGSSYPLLASTSLLDIVDGHTYWQHPGPRGIPNTPMVNAPLQSTVVELSRTAFAGKPYTVSEVNHPFPNDYASEGFPILAAYAALQDWDGVFWYTFEPKASVDWKPLIGDPFDISHNPVKMTQLAAGALMFVRGDVRAARQIIQRSYSTTGSRQHPPAGGREAVLHARLPAVAAAAPRFAHRIAGRVAYEEDRTQRSRSNSFRHRRIGLVRFAGDRRSRHC